MKVLFCIAHPNELKRIKPAVKELKIRELSADFLITGVGPYETIFNMTKYLEKEKPDFLINIGICGQSGDSNGIIQIGRSVNQSGREQLVPICFEFAELKSIISLDRPAKYIEELGTEEFVDMESFAFEFVASKYRIPRIILKSVADKVGSKIGPNEINGFADNLLKIDFAGLLGKILSYLNSLPKDEDYTEIFGKLRLTHSEKEIMRSRIRKYEALTKKDFRDYFDANTSKNKREIFDELENIFSFDT